LLVESFTAKSNRRDTVCRACRNARQRERYATDEGFRQERLSHATNYRADNPTRDRNYVGGWAPQAVYQAVKTGKLKKLPCVVCGNSRVHAHHPNGYEGQSIYDVIWLCPLHHKQTHRN